MGLPKPVKRYTPQEYYALERNAPYKSDYYRGEIFAMAGGTSRHSLIAGNIIGELHQRLKGSACAVYESNLRLKIQATGLRTYPDAAVYCTALERDEEDKDGETVTNPTVLFEVLSRTTEAYDRGLKAANYRQIPSPRAYLLVSQQEPGVEMFERQAGGSWLLSEARGREASLTISSIAVTLRLADVYDRINFDDPQGAEPVISATSNPS
jgi:Uma2 family endonuclease